MRLIWLLCFSVSHKKDAGTSSMVVQKNDEWLRAHEIERLREEFEQPGETEFTRQKVQQE